MVAAMLAARCSPRRIFSAGFMGVWGPCRDLCCDACCDASTLRLVEALPLSERLGHTPRDAWCLGILPRSLLRRWLRRCFAATGGLPLSERLGHTLGMPGVCCDDGCDELRLVEALPLSERLGHTVLGLLEGFAAIVYKLSEAALLGLGRRENIRLLMMFDVASLVWGMQNSQGAGDPVPRTLCLEELVPDVHQFAQPCAFASFLHLAFLVVQMGSPELRVARRRNGRRGAGCGTGSTSRTIFFEVVQIEPEVEEVFDLVGVAELEGWDQTELMYFVFEVRDEEGHAVLSGVL